MHLVYRYESQLHRGRKRGPEKEAVRGVERQAAAAVRLNDRLRQIAEELIQIVEIAESARTNIRSIEDVPAQLVARGPLELPVRTATTIREFDGTRASIRYA